MKRKIILVGHHNPETHLELLVGDIVSLVEQSPGGQTPSKSWCTKMYGRTYRVTEKTNISSKTGKTLDWEVYRLVDCGSGQDIGTVSGIWLKRDAFMTDVLEALDAPLGQ